jgi:predicted enzyme related to lactoylglutathione lyase
LRSIIDFFYLGANRIALPLALLLTAGSCGESFTVPPLTDLPTASYRHGEFVWHDLLTDDLGSAQHFYGAVFGWTFEEIERDVYVVARENGVPIAGLLAADRVEATVSGTRWISYASVQDVDSIVGVFRRNGGQVFTEPRDISDRGRIAAVADPEGAVVALITATGGDPVRAEPVVNRWLWTELWSSDPRAASDFYRAIGGYETEAFDPPWDRPDDIDYLVLKLGDRSVAGILQNPYGDVQPNWLPYILVDDPSVVAQRADESGGRVLLAPDSLVRQGSLAILADPSGGAFAVQKWPLDQPDE